MISVLLYLILIILLIVRRYKITFFIFKSFHNNSLDIMYQNVNKLPLLNVKIKLLLIILLEIANYVLNLISKTFYKFIQ